MKSSDELDPNRYHLPTALRRALWENETAMFIVLYLPVGVTTFWYGSMVQNVDLVGRVIAPASIGRGVGLTFLITLLTMVGAAIYLFIQPAAERLRNAQPVRGPRRLAYAGFDGLLVGLITWQAMPGMRVNDVSIGGATSVGLGVAAALIAFVAMHSMVEIPSDHDAALT